MLTRITTNKARRSINKILGGHPPDLKTVLMLYYTVGVMDDGQNIVRYLEPKIDFESRLRLLRESYPKTL